MTRGLVLVGFLAGLLLSFGLAVLLFEIGESGHNTRPWQMVVGCYLPAALLLGGSVMACRTSRVGSQLLAFGVAAFSGLLLGCAAILAMAWLG